MRVFIANLIFISILCCFFSCSSPGKSKNIKTTDSLVVDSTRMIQPDHLAYVFFDSIPVFDIDKKDEIIDYLYLGDKVNLDEEFETYNRVDLERLNEATFSYTKTGKTKKGSTLFNYFALRVCSSKMDSSLLYMGNLIPGEYDSDDLRLRIVKNGKLLFDTLTYTNLEQGHDLDLYRVDSTTLTSAGEVIYVNAWLGFGDFQNHDWYFSYKNKRLSTIVHTYGRFDGEEWSYSNVYLPVRLSGKDLMSDFINGEISRDSMGRTDALNYPADLKTMANQLIYVEELREKEMDGNKADVIYGVWLKWNGTGLDSLKTK